MIKWINGLTNRKKGRYSLLSCADGTVSWLSRHLSLSSIVLGRSTRQRPESTQNWCMFVPGGRSTLVYLHIYHAEFSDYTLYGPNHTFLSQKLLSSEHPKKDIWVIMKIVYLIIKRFYLSHLIKVLLLHSFRVLIMWVFFPFCFLKLQIGENPAFLFYFNQARWSKRFR